MSRQALADLATGLLLALALALLLPLSAARAPGLFLNIGPNDEYYINNFRSDWEPEGRTRFRWTTLRSALVFPVRASGDGWTLRLRARRHFLEPAEIHLVVDGQTAGSFSIQADPHTAYRVLELPLPPLPGSGPLRVEILARSENPRPLGVALDWVELRRDRSAARFGLLPASLWRSSALVAGLWLGLTLAGLPRRKRLVVACALLAACLWGAHRDLLAYERIVREGALLFAAVSLLIGGWLAIGAGTRWLRLPADHLPVAGILALLVLGALAIRLVLLLHPRFYYPDVRVHGTLLRELVKLGLPAFLQDYTLLQYRYSLGLQFESGHWYAFPYPPAFYLLGWPCVRLLGWEPQVAVALVGALANSLEVLVVYALARRLCSRPQTALLAAGAVTCLPLFLVRLSLAYFPALVGHLVDAVLMLFLVARWQRLGEPRTVVGFGLLLGGALLTYTQSLLNWGLFLPMLLAAWLLASHSPARRLSQWGLVAGGILALALALFFYARYIPIFVGMRQGVPMPEERVLLEKQAAALASRPAGAVEVEEPPDDPFAGPGFDLLRGLRKAAWRLWIFYGLFAFAVMFGLWSLLADLESRELRLLVVLWASLYLLLNLGSGALPGPNLIRYNKDLESVAPLFCIALGRCAAFLIERLRPAGWSFVVAYLGWGLWRGYVALVEKFYVVGR